MKCGVPGKHPGREECHVKNGHKGCQVWRQPDCQFILTEEISGQPVKLNKELGVIIVAEIEIPAPLPVICLVRNQQKMSTQKNTYYQAEKEEYPGCL